MSFLRSEPKRKARESTKPCNMYLLELGYKTVQFDESADFQGLVDGPG